jgi:hypothetical protein
MADLSVIAIGLGVFAALGFFVPDFIKQLHEREGRAWNFSWHI